MTVCCTHHLCGLVGCHTVSQKLFLETTVVYVDVIDFNLPINQSWKKNVKKNHHFSMPIQIPSFISKKKCHWNLMCSFFGFFQTYKHFMPFFTPFPNAKVSVAIGVTSSVPTPHLEEESPQDLSRQVVFHRSDFWGDPKKGRCFWG